MLLVLLGEFQQCFGGEQLGQFYVVFLVICRCVIGCLCIGQLSSVVSRFRRIDNCQIRLQLLVWLQIILFNQLLRKVFNWWKRNMMLLSIDRLCMLNRVVMVLLVRGIVDSYSSFMVMLKVQVLQMFSGSQRNSMIIILCIRYSVVSRCGFDQCLLSQLVMQVLNMLNSLISVSIVVLICVGRCWLIRQVGRCMLMNIIWKLQMKKFSVSSQNLECVQVLCSVLLRFCLWFCGGNG